MPTETQHLEQRVAALQSDLNTKDEQIDALTFSDNDRELSRRDWFDEAKRLEKENEGLRSEVKRLDLMVSQADHDYEMKRNDLERQLAERDALLGRIYEASEWTHDAVHYQEVVQKLVYDTLSASAEPSEREAHALQAEKALGIERLPATPRDERAEFEQAFVVQEGVFFSKERNEYRSMNGRPVERTDATDLNLRLQGWQARAALDKATEGASHE
ncbi:hypothetical protein C5U62_22950 [Pseudomonas protegens]|uniref:Uncharacterized protein n=1 Tax=Pseudomonas protegens TaxID=380021 RepID=A0A2T6GH53_9PSED|nr:hypothetical protein [Pseudomonas protegens]PUA43487.1 hypothetical protein C5U62_22950 [Pseudomonas protegens]